LGLIPPPTDEDRLAYRVIIWAHCCPYTGLPGFGLSKCGFGLPGDPCWDWRLRFEELGWIKMMMGPLVSSALDELKSLSSPDDFLTVIPRRPEGE